VATAEAYLHAKFRLDPCSRLGTIDTGRKLGGALPPLWGGELGPHPTQCRLGLPSYQVASWSIEPFGHNRCGWKIGGCVPLGEGDLTQCGQGRDLPPCQV